MKVGDFLLSSLEGDPSRRSFVAEIISIDWPAEFLTCRQVETDQRFTFGFSSTTSGPWTGADDEGVDRVLASPDIYTARASDPVAGGTAVVTFDDNRSYLCSVENVSPETDVTLYQPHQRLSFDLTEITRSDWEAYPAGGQITSIEAFALNNEITPPAPSRVFRNGWWSLARRLPAFPGRIGGAIAPFATVVHTTDMVPGDWDSLLRGWTTRAGNGACAHFLIGRDPAHGIVQLAPITNNANHAGGPGHGSFATAAQTWHPNDVSVGIEVHCAGAVRQIAGAWRLVEDGAPHGAAIPNADVLPDPQRPGRGWHAITAYQYEQLGYLLDGLETVLGALPVGCMARSIEQPPQYGLFATARVVGHVSVHAAQRGDPWPAACDWIRARP